MLRNYKDLKVWQKAYELCLKIYRITKAFPKEEIYGLVSQMRRASVSIASNIAEGYGRGYTQEYIHHLHIGYGSGTELETQLMLSRDLKYVKGKEYEETIDMYQEVERMLSALIRSLENKKRTEGSRGQGVKGSRDRGVRDSRSRVKK